MTALPVCGWVGRDFSFWGPVVAEGSSWCLRLGVCVCVNVTFSADENIQNNASAASLETGVESPRHAIWFSFGNTCHMIEWSRLSEPHTQNMWDILAEKTIAVGKLLSILVWTQQNQYWIQILYKCGFFYSVTGESRWLPAAAKHLSQRIHCCCLLLYDPRADSNSFETNRTLTNFISLSR